MASFHGWGSTASRLEPLRGGSLVFSTKFPEIPGTHFIDLGRMNGWTWWLPEVQNSYFVEQCLMTNSENIKICNSLLY